MGTKTKKTLGIAALVVSLLPLGTLISVALFITLTDTVWNIWAGANCQPCRAA